MKRVVYHRLALSELFGDSAFYDRRQRGLGDRFVSAVEIAVAVVASQPLHGRPEASDTRSWPTKRFPYRVVYRIEPDRIWIVAVAHASRRARLLATPARRLRARMNQTFERCSARRSSCLCRDRRHQCFLARASVLMKMCSTNTCLPAFNKRNASLLGLILAEVAMIIYLFNPDNPFRQRHEEAGETLRANETQETVAAYYDAKGAYIRHQIGIAAGMLLIGVGFLVVAYLPKQHPAS